MKEALTLVDSQAKVQNVEIRTHFPPEPCQVLGVPSLLEQVFINLLLNAMNAMPNGGTVDIAEQAAGEVLLRVTDTGEGTRRKTSTRSSILSSQKLLSERHRPWVIHLQLHRRSARGSIAWTQRGKGSISGELPSLSVTQER